MFKALFKGSSKAANQLSIEGTNFRTSMKPNQSVLTAAVDARFKVPNYCGVGECGTCRCRVMDGRVRHMSDSSGHYKPEPWRTRRVVRLMRDRGADLSQMRLSGHVATEYGGSVSLTAAQVQKFILANP